MRKIIYFMAVMLLLSACSSEPKTEETSVTEKANVTEAGYTTGEVKYYEIKDPGRPLTDIEKEMLRYPGVFSGDQYDEAKVNAALDELPDNLTKDQYLEELIQLLSEDYHKELETLIHFDPTVNVNIERPDETVNAPTLKKAHYAVLIDASGSMMAKAGNKTRMDAAKEAVRDFAENIPENATLSLRVYGHKGSNNEADKAVSCGSSESFYNGTFNQSEFNQALNQVKAVGWTPIGLALETVKEDIPTDADDVIVYVVSDGIETCGGNPVKAAKDLVSANVKTVVNIIGFDVDNEGQRLLKEVADAGNGEFTSVNSEQDLKKYMRAQYEEIQKAWLEWKEQGKTTAMDMKEEKKKLAESTKESMKEKSNREKERMKKALEYLKTRFKDHSHPVYSLFSPIVDYGNAKWRYAVDQGNAAWRDSVDNGNKEWNDIVDEGNKKINETIQKKYQQ